MDLLLDQNLLVVLSTFLGLLSVNDVKIYRDCFVFLHGVVICHVIIG